MDADQDSIEINLTDEELELCAQLYVHKNMRSVVHAGFVRDCAAGIPVQQALFNAVISEIANEALEQVLIDAKAGC
jgi:hypothetical protein